MASPSKCTITYRKRPSRRAPPVPKDDYRIEALQDGTRVLVRPLHPEDHEFERTFIKHLSPRSRRLRFLGDFKEPSPALLDQLMNVDYVHEMAYVALIHENGRLREVGVSRYATSADGRQCECAVTVANGWRQRGLTPLLMRHLIDVARKHGLTGMFTVEDPANDGIRELAGHLGFQCAAEPCDPQLVRYTLSL